MADQRFKVNNTSQITGTRELSQKLSQLGSRVGGRALRQATRQAALPIQRAAEARAPRGTRAHYTYTGRKVAPGFLSRNIKRTAWISRNGRYAKVRIGPTEEAFYGTQFIELGTSRIAPQPWLVPAHESAKDLATARLSKRLKAIIERVAKKK